MIAQNLPSCVSFHENNGIKRVHFSSMINGYFYISQDHSFPSFLIQQHSEDRKKEIVKDICKKLTQLEKVISYMNGKINDMNYMKQELCSRYNSEFRRMENAYNKKISALYKNYLPAIEKASSIYSTSLEANLQQLRADSTAAFRKIILQMNSFETSFTQQINSMKKDLNQIAHVQNFDLIYPEKKTSPNIQRMIESIRIHDIEAQRKYDLFKADAEAIFADLELKHQKDIETINNEFKSKRLRMRKTPINVGAIHSAKGRLFRLKGQIEVYKAKIRLFTHLFELYNLRNKPRVDILDMIQIQKEKYQIQLRQQQEKNDLEYEAKKKEFEALLNKPFEYTPPKPPEKPVYHFDPTPINQLYESQLNELQQSIEMIKEPRVHKSGKISKWKEYRHQVALSIDSERKELTLKYRYLEQLENSRHVLFMSSAQGCESLSLAKQVLSLKLLRLKLDNYKQLLEVREEKAKINLQKAKQRCQNLGMRDIERQKIRDLEDEVVRKSEELATLGKDLVLLRERNSAEKPKLVQQQPTIVTPNIRK